MHRLLALVLPALFLAVATPAAGQVDRDALRQGLIYDGLQRSAAGDPCRGAYRLASLSARGMPVCTHGPDPAPPGVDVRTERQPPQAAATEAAQDGQVATAAAAQVPCFGNGSDGFRVQLVYARASDKADGYASWLASFQQWAARIDDVFNASAAETGGVAHVRFVHDSGCVPVIDNVVLSPQGDDNFDKTYSEMVARGYSRTDRKYLVWVDANVYCAIAQIWDDDSPGQNNTSNGNPNIAGVLGRVDKGCWGQTNPAEAHELVHTMGGVQPSAPNATPGYHCTDEYDRLCYNDGTGFVRIVCPSSSHEARLDCNHDDYFSTNPPANSYLATHWNVARSVFLSTSGTPAPPPPTTTTTLAPAATTTTTRPPGSSTTTTTTTTTTTIAPPPPSGSVASAPQGFYATQPGSPGKGVLLVWTPPASAGNPPFTTYRLYRGPTATNLTKLVDLPAGITSYNDTATTSGALYWYMLRAVNTAGESAPSNLTRMIAR